MFASIEINIIGLVILLIVILNIPFKKNKILFDQKLFLGLIFFDALAMILDTIQISLNGKPGFLIRVIEYSDIILFFIINPMPCMLYTLYVDFQIYHNRIKTKKRIFKLMVPIIFNAILAILSPFKHYIFYFDSNNIYHRGNYVPVVALICFSYIIIGIIQIILKRKKLKKSEFYALLIFTLPPTIGGIVQTIYYGVTLLWICVAISVLFVYMNIQNRNLYTDYLTGLNNRRQLDAYLLEILNKNSRCNYLAGIMIDVNDFKKINDFYGHDIGDQALRDTSNILKKSFRKDDFIARYGGDEFVIVIEVNDFNDMESAIKRLRKYTDEFNNMKKNAYKLSLSIGYDLFDLKSGMTIKEFLKKIDELMYKDKKNQKSQNILIKTEL